jgi:hypothetical protein
LGGRGQPVPQANAALETDVSSAGVAYAMVMMGL